MRAFRPAVPHRPRIPHCPLAIHFPSSRRTGRFVTDGGLETTLIFQRGLGLPDFAAFVLLEDATGRQALHDYCWAAAAAPTTGTWPR
jgi:S-methylmethionine-dependent homocysteine/selenocysteine methylase